MKKKPTKDGIRKQLHKKLEALWKTYCKARDGGKCKLCTSTNTLQVHHIFSRKKTRLFIDVDNGITLCRDCHCRVTWNDSTKETVRRMVDPDIYDRIYEESCKQSVFLDWKNIFWLEQQVMILEELLKEVRGE
jgi:5-methylcytosine-specific restriction endonuclease McrA